LDKAAEYVIATLPLNGLKMPDLAVPRRNNSCVQRAAQKRGDAATAP